MSESADFFDEVRACVESLRRAGLEEDARCLDASLYGATGGELLALAGNCLERALERAELSGELRTRLGHLLSAVDRALRNA